MRAQHAPDERDPDSPPRPEEAPPLPEPPPERPPEPHDPEILPPGPPERGAGLDWAFGTGRWAI